MIARIRSSIVAISFIAIILHLNLFWSEIDILSHRTKRNKYDEILRDQEETSPDTAITFRKTDSQNISIDEQLFSIDSIKAKESQQANVTRFGDDRSTMLLPLQNFIFIKLQKVGGTTLKSILIRHAYERGLILGGRHAANSSAPCNLFAQHTSLPAYLQNPVVQLPAAFLTLLRDPLEHMASAFYWNIQQFGFHRELPANLSAAHHTALLNYAHLHANSSRRGRRRRPWPEPGMTAEAPSEAAEVPSAHVPEYWQQWEWFTEELDEANGPAAAARRLRELEFEVGFVEVAAPPPPCMTFWPPLRSVRRVLIHLCARMSPSAVLCPNQACPDHQGQQSRPSSRAEEGLDRA